MVTPYQSGRWWYGGQLLGGKPNVWCPSLAIPPLGMEEVSLAMTFFPRVLVHSFCEGSPPFCVDSCFSAWSMATELPKPSRRQQGMAMVISRQLRGCKVERWSSATIPIGCGVHGASGWSVPDTPHAVFLSSGGLGSRKLCDVGCYTITVSWHVCLSSTCAEAEIHGNSGALRSVVESVFRCPVFGVFFSAGSPCFHCEALCPLRHPCCYHVCWSGDSWEQWHTAIGWGLLGNDGFYPRVVVCAFFSHFSSRSTNEKTVVSEQRIVEDTIEGLISCASGGVGRLLYVSSAFTLVLRPQQVPVEQQSNPEVLTMPGLSFARGVGCAISACLGSDDSKEWWLLFRGNFVRRVFSLRQRHFADCKWIARSERRKCFWCSSHSVFIRRSRSIASLFPCWSASSNWFLSELGPLLLMSTRSELSVLRLRGHVSEISASWLEVTCSSSVRCAW